MALCKHDEVQIKDGMMLADTVRSPSSPHRQEALDGGRQLVDSAPLSWDPQPSLRGTIQLDGNERDALNRSSLTAMSLSPNHSPRSTGLLDFLHTKELPAPDQALTDNAAGSADDEEPECRPPSSPIRAAAPCIDDSWRCINCLQFNDDPRALICQACGSDRTAEDEEASEPGCLPDDENDERIAAYCVNLDRRTDRWLATEEELGYLADIVKAEKYSAVDGKDITAETNGRDDVCREWDSAAVVKWDPRVQHQVSAALDSASHLLCVPHCVAES